MTIRDNDFSNVSHNQHFENNATFQAKEKTDSLGNKIIVFKTKEAMKTEEQIKEILKMIGITLFTCLAALAFKDFRKDWKKAIFGENKKIIQIPIPQGFPLDINKGAELNLTQVKNISSEIEIARRIKNREEKIEVDPNLSNIISGKIQFPGYELKSDSENLHYYLVKTLDDFDNIETFNKTELRNTIERNQQMSLKQALDNLDKAADKLPVNDFLLSSLNSVTNSNEISVARNTMECQQNDVSFELDVAVAMRKGYEKAVTPKAMGEDAFVIDEVSINFQGKAYTIPIIATLDGGGGHTFAQYGRKEIKTTFEKHLNDVINAHGKLDSSIICRAMKKTDDELFEIDKKNAKYLGSGYKRLKENHDAVEKEFGIPVDQFKGIFQNLVDRNSQKLMLNPMEIHNEIINNNLNIDNIIKINGKNYDLKEEFTAKKLQKYYAKSMGTEQKIEVQIVMNAFFVNEKNELECVTYNRGDSLALHVGAEETTAISERVKNLRSNQSKMALQDGSRIVSMSDGVHEVISINELEDANNSDILKEKDSEEYVTTLMQASRYTGSGDDKTIISAKVRILENIPQLKSF